MSQNHLTDLALKLDFTTEDLYANRDGTMSEAQRQKLRRALLREAILYGALEVVLIGLAFVFLGSIMRQANEGTLLFLALFVLMASIYPVYIARKYRATRDDLAAGNVTMAAGRISLYDVGRGNYRLEIGKRSFNVSRKVYASFVNGRDYRLYFAPKLRTILSAEPED